MHRTLIATAAAMSLGLSAQVASADPSGDGPARRGPFHSVPLSAAALAAHRGGDASLGGTQITGAVSNNQATNVVTGNNTIGDGAFAGAAGISTVIQNSGNNVLIQNATIVNLQLK